MMMFVVCVDTYFSIYPVYVFRYFFACLSWGVVASKVGAVGWNILYSYDGMYDVYTTKGGEKK